MDKNLKKYLKEAVAASDYYRADFLLNVGAQYDIHGFSFYCASDMAIMSGDIKMVKLFSKYDRKISTRRIVGYPPILLAKTYGYDNVANFLNKIKKMESTQKQQTNVLNTFKQMINKIKG